MTENKEAFITMADVEPGMFGVKFPQKINWTINRGEQWAVVGSNGSGKSLLAEVLLGHTSFRGNLVRYNFFDNKPEEFKKNHYATECIKKVCFESAYTLADYSNMYYQQRFSATENEDNPLVGDVLKSADASDDDIKFWTERLNLSPLLHKRVIMLSSGELRRFLIASILIKKPDLVIFDNPFIGLDKEMCVQLNNFFKELSPYLQMIFIVPAVSEIPDMVTHIMPVKDMHFGPGLTREEFDGNSELQRDLFDERKFEQVEFPESTLPPANYSLVMKMENITIKYPSRVLFDNLNWTIRKGEKWALLGPNGSGKSTLLSLLAADNPMAYALNITLFDRRRGTGETIWDIKHKIGYISSEMHLFFHANQTCLKVVASGFFDTIGLYRQCTDDQNAKALQVMKMLGIDTLSERPYLKVSSGEQRLVLLARTLVKNPDLLILDEPLHGLDQNNKNNAISVIERFCAQENKTLIYVTHRRDEIPKCVDKIFELKRI